VRSFCQTWFIGRWPEDVEITLVSRTIGDTQLVDELVSCDLAINLDTLGCWGGASQWRVKRAFQNAPC